MAQVALGNGGFVIKGDNAYDLSGVSVNSGGDINGDGYADLLIGAHGAGSGTASGANTGASYVVFGRATMPTGSTGINLSTIAAGGAGAGGFAIISDTPAAFSGHSISSAGDINGDGLMDIIVSAPAADPSVLNQGGTNSGLSYVIYGKTSTLPSIYPTFITTLAALPSWGTTPTNTADGRSVQQATSMAMASPTCWWAHLVLTMAPRPTQA